MSLFTSARERRLWLWTLAVVLAIYSTLGLASQWAGLLRDRGLLSNVIWLGLFLIAAAILTLALKTRPRGMEIGVALGVAAVYIIVLARLALPEERSHLIEYSVVAAFIYQGLIERKRNGRLNPSAPPLAFAITSALGFLDEIIQAILPNRFFDLRDLGFNVLTALMAILATLVLARVRTWHRHG